MKLQYLFPRVSSRTLCSFVSALVFLNSAIFTHAQAGLNRNPNQSTVIFIADNQEHQLTGAPLKSMSAFSDRFFTSVALRSPLANIGGRSLLGEILEFGRREGAGLAVHLGDASDISCPDELTGVFETMQKHYGENWFMTLGNHDGFQSGTFSKYSPQYDYSIPDIYTKPPWEGHSLGQIAWLNACLSPTNLHSLRANVLTKGDAIGMYVSQLMGRPGARKTRLRLEKVSFKVGRPQPLPVECRVEEITIAGSSYRAVARICPRTTIPHDTQRWVGPSASYLIQKIGFDGTSMLLLDTSDYEDPSLRNVALTGQFSDAQKAEAATFLTNDSRDTLIFAGHHPFDVMRLADKKWIAERASRYMSAHIHRSAQLLNHAPDFSVKELNLGSTLDFPPQATIGSFESGNLNFRVAGASIKHAETNWPAFIQPCIDNEEQWALSDTLYADKYREGKYIRRLIEAFREAAEVYNTKVAPNGPRLEVPSGRAKEDWPLLDRALQRVASSEGLERQFWGCQAYYASAATGAEESVGEKLMRWFGRKHKKGDRATGERKTFSP